MKTPLFFIAAITAFFALPFDFASMFAVLFGAGIVAITIADYRWKYRPMRAAVACVAVARPEHLRLAA